MVTHQEYINKVTGKKYFTQGLYDSNAYVITYLGTSKSLKYNACDLENKNLFRNVTYESTAR